MNDTDTSLATLVAEELAAAMQRNKIKFNSCEVRACGHVGIEFSHVAHATVLVAKGVATGGPGSLDDRAQCGTLTGIDLAEAGVPVTDDRMQAALDTGWVWAVLPVVTVSERDYRSVRWAATVDMTMADAMELAVNLNRAAQGGVR